MNNSDQFKYLFERYLKGQCTAEELNILLGYFRETETQDTSVIGLIQENLNRDIPMHDENNFAIQEAVDEVHFRIQKAIQQEKKDRLKKISIPGWMRMAAVWVLLFGAMGMMVYYLAAGLETAVPMQQLLTKKGERAKLTLPDGTKIWLSPSSRLDYPQNFTGKTRTVSLSGEAFFAVAPDKNRPFIIQSTGLSTKVVGTSFNIKSYEEQKTAMVTVVSGKVDVRMQELQGGSAREVTLEPNQRVIFHKRSYVLKKEEYPEAARLLDEREGRFVFEGAPVAEVLAEVRRQYNVDIHVKGDISKCRFYGELDTRESISFFLRKLCLSIHAKRHEGNGIYVIETKGC